MRARNRTALVRPTDAWSLLLYGFLVLCTVGVLSGCDSAPGPSNPVGRPPVVSDLVFDPVEIDVMDLDPAEVAAGVASVDLTVSVRATDADGDVSRVLMVVQTPDQETPILEFTQLTRSSGDSFGGTFTLDFDTGLTGRYTIEVYAVDNDEFASNSVLGGLDLVNIGNPPVIETVEAPDTIQRPQSGTTPIPLIAVVSDPEGISNIASVVFWNINDPGTTFALFDDGQNGGDEVAGDGRYTITVEIASTARTGLNEFVFQATDRGGLKSNTFVKEITVE